MIARSNQSGNTVTNKPKIVVDTGILISAFAFDGTPEQAVRKAFREYRIYVSMQLLEEYSTTPLTLFKKKKLTHQQFEILVAGVASFVISAKLVEAKATSRTSRDPNDDMLIDLCLAAKADVLLTGDNDLLVLKDAGLPFSILTAREFMGIG